MVSINPSLSTAGRRLGALMLALLLCLNQVWGLEIPDDAPVPEGEQQEEAPETSPGEEIVPAELEPGQWEALESPPAATEPPLTDAASPGQEETVSEETGAGVSTPVLALTYVPPLGQKRTLCGCLFRADGGNVDPAAYRISLYLQITPDGPAWKKPTDDKPYVEIASDGYFSASFITGGQDDQAAVIHVLLIPASYTPTDDLQATVNAAVDYVRVERRAGGKISISPERSAPDRPVPFSDLLPVGKNRIAVDVGFHTDGTYPGSGLSDELILRQLNALAPYADTLRFYSAGGEIQRAYVLAHDMGFHIVGTAWLCGRAAEDRAELDALIALCNQGLVELACVGSETLLRGELTEDRLVESIRYVRNGIHNSAIPVTTADSLGLLLEHSALRCACDILLPNCYPYWSGTALADAAEDFAQSMANLKGASGNKRIIVSETGWPTQGGSEGAAVAGEEESAAYFDAVRQWSLDTKTTVLWFDGADEPWKVRDEGEVGGHWGLFTSRMELKAAYWNTDFFRSFQKSPQKLTLSAPSVVVGKTIAIRGAVGRTTYTSSNPGVATVSAKGVVKGVRPGTVTVTVKAAGDKTHKSITKQFKITVYRHATPVLTGAKAVREGVKVSWKKVSGAAAYRVFYKTGGKGWTSAGITTNTSFLWKKAVSGKTYAFTVRCVTKNGKSSTSDYNRTGKRLTWLAVPGLKVSSPKAETIRATWNQVAGVGGYQLQYSTDKAFPKGSKPVTLSGRTKVSKTLSHLKAKKRYYLRIRSWKTVSGKKVFSPWSKTASVLTN